MLNLNYKDRLNNIREFILPARLLNHTSDDHVVIDPVCGKEFKDAKFACAMVSDGDMKLYFCSIECKTEFSKHPEKYLKQENELVQ